MDFNNSLKKSLQNIHGYFFSIITLFFLKNNIFEAIIDKKRIEEICEKNGFKQDIFEGIIDFYVCDEILERNGERLVFTEYGQLFFKQSGWFKLLIGGYAPTISNLELILKNGQEVSERDEFLVSLGSGEIDKYDIIPSAKKIISEFKIIPLSILDLGCGTGQLLIELCEHFNCNCGTGVTLSYKNKMFADCLLKDENIKSKVKFIVSDIFQYEPSEQYDIVLSSFVLQEILYQRGRNKLIDFLNRLSDRLKDSIFMFFEVRLVEDIEHYKKINIKDYYSTYVLLHKLTKQRLLSNDQWLSIFNETKLKLTSIHDVATSYDHSGLEVCYILKSL